MSKSTTPVWLSIFIAGLIAGFVFAVGLKFGISPDPIEISNYVLQQVCTLEKTNGLVAYNCSIFIPLGIILSVVVGLASILIEANRIQSWKIGLCIYGAGWIVGLLYTLSSVK